MFRCLIPVLWLCPNSLLNLWMPHFPPQDKEWDHKGEGIETKGYVPPFPSHGTGTGTGTTPGSHHSWILPCLGTHFPN